MGKWIPYGEKFIAGDVIRWIEPIWLELKKRRVTAAVVKVDASGYVSLPVCACESS